MKQRRDKVDTTPQTERVAQRATLLGSMARWAGGGAESADTVSCTVTTGALLSSEAGRVGNVATDTWLQRHRTFETRTGTKARQL